MRIYVTGEERETMRKVANKQIEMEDIQKRIDIINKSQDKFEYTLKYRKGTMLEYEIQVRRKAEETILAVRGFFDKVEILSHLRGMENILSSL